MQMMLRMLLQLEFIAETSAILLTVPGASHIRFAHTVATANIPYITSRTFDFEVILMILQHRPVLEPFEANLALLSGCVVFNSEISHGDRALIIRS